MSFRGPPPRPDLPGCRPPAEEGHRLLQTLRWSSRYPRRWLLVTPHSPSRPAALSPAGIPRLPVASMPNSRRRLEGSVVKRCAGIHRRPLSPAPVGRPMLAIRSGHLKVPTGKPLYRNVYQPHFSRLRGPLADAQPSTAGHLVREGKCVLETTRLSCQVFVANGLGLAPFVMAKNLGTSYAGHVCPLL